MELIYRKIEGGGSEGRFEPVLVTHPTSTGRSAKQYRYLLSTSTGRMSDQYWFVFLPI